MLPIVWHIIVARYTEIYRPENIARNFQWLDDLDVADKMLSRSNQGHTMRGCSEYLRELESPGGKVRWKIQEFGEQSGGRFA